jgi:hypothetical protein
MVFPLKIDEFSNILFLEHQTLLFKNKNKNWHKSAEPAILVL